MIRINLLPVKTQAKIETGSKQILAFAGIVLLCILIVGVLWFSQKNKIRALEPKAKALRAELAKYKGVDARLKRLKKNKEQVLKRIEIIKQLQKNRDSLVRILAMLTETVPKEKIWFNKLEERGKAITIHGVALSNEAISQFMRNLERSIYVGYGRVNLIESAQKIIAGRKLRSFKLRFLFRTPSEIKAMLARRANIQKERAKGKKANK
ncbi:MAG: hypothetical protein DRG59_08180 [Deltaproteobacteria bacterium]|nr:MAG: hypothetical protein DRG59_08180 [Deltaproteobacteria bacterium]